VGLLVFDFGRIDALLPRILYEFHERLPQAFMPRNAQNQSVVEFFLGYHLAQCLLNLLLAGLLILHPVLVEPDDVLDHIFHVPNLDLLSLSQLFVGLVAFLHYISAELTWLAWNRLGLRIIRDIICHWFKVVSKGVENFDQSVLEMYFCEFSDFLVHSSGKMVQDLYLLRVLVGKFDLEMVRMSDNPISKLKSLFEVALCRLLAIQNVPNLFLRLVYHTTNINYELTFGRSYCCP